MSTEKIPFFPEFRVIQQQDRECLEEYLAQQYIEPAELTFPNMYAWREYDTPRVSLLNGNLVILSNPHNENSCRFMQPLGGFKIAETIQTCLAYLKKEHTCSLPRIARVQESYIKEFNLEKYFKCELDTDNCDYLYRTEDLAQLRGRKYSGKRNHIKKLFEQGNYTYKKFTEEHVEGCKKVLAEWSKNKFSTEDIENLETLIFGEKAILEYLNKFTRLGLLGGVVFRDEKLVGFTLGSRLNKDTVVTYAETSMPGETGVNQFLNQEFSKQLLPDFEFVNREQDLGHPGLRKAKQSYYPVKLVNKYTVSEKE